MRSGGGVDDSVVGKAQGKNAIVEADLSTDFEKGVASLASLRQRRGGVSGPVKLERVRLEAQDGRSRSVGGNDNRISERALERRPLHPQFLRSQY